MGFNRIFIYNTRVLLLYTSIFPISTNITPICSPEVRRSTGNHISVFGAQVSGISEIPNSAIPHSEKFVTWE